MIRPYTFDELIIALKQHGPLILRKDRDYIANMMFASRDHKDFAQDMQRLLDEFVWLDDETPCGITSD